MQWMLFRKQTLFAVSLVAVWLAGTIPVLAGSIPVEPNPHESRVPIKQVQAPSLKVQFLISEPGSLVRFIETIAGQPHTTSWVRDWYFAKRGDKASSEKELCKRYLKHIDILGKHYKFRDVTGREMDTTQMALVTASECSNVDDLLKRLKTKLKPTDFTAVAETYKHFEPIFHEMIWLPRLESLKSQLADFRQEAARSKINERLAQVQAFMNSTWPAKTPFNIVLIPLPEADRKGSHGESIGRTQLVELRTSSSFKDHCDVVFHEACHALWGRKKDLSWLDEQFAKYHGAIAGSELNEGLATALGQGWFVDIAFGGGGVSGRWYNDPFINGYGHALFPIVCRYLKEGKTIDADFARQASEAFAKQFPNAARSIKSCWELIVYVDKMPADRTDLSKEITNGFPLLHSLIFHSLGETSLTGWEKQAPFGRRIVLAAPASVRKLCKSELSGDQYRLLTNSEGKNVCLSVKGQKVIFCLGNDFSRQMAMLHALLRSGTWPAPAVRTSN